MSSNERTSVQVTLVAMLSAASYFGGPITWDELAVLGACIFGLRVIGIMLEAAGYKP